jgi:hypothetical protein
MSDDGLAPTAPFVTIKAARRQPSFRARLRGRTQITQLRQLFARARADSDRPPPSVTAPGGAELPGRPQPPGLRKKSCSSAGPARGRRPEAEAPTGRRRARGRPAAS